MEQLKIEGCKPNNRPGFDQIKKEFYKEAYKVLGYNNCLSENDSFYDINFLLENIFKKESDAMKDSYDIAKDFEDQGFDVDRSFIDVVDEILDLYTNIKKKNIAFWVKENNIKPKYKSGDIVKYNGVERKIYEMDIYDHMYAKYPLLIPGKDKTYNSISFEDVESQN